MQIEGGEVDDDTAVTSSFYMPDTNTFIYPHSGAMTAITGAWSTNNTLTQHVTATPGATYNFSFWINNPTTTTTTTTSSTSNSFVATVQFGSGEQVTVYAASGMDSTRGEWVLHSALVSAPVGGGSALQLTLLSFDESSFFLLDDVSLVQVNYAITTLAPVSVMGDPQFVGLLGQTFQVHGMDGQVYSLIYDQTGVLVNAQFMFLSSGACPSTAVVHTACWSHPGSYLGSVGVVSAAGHRLSVASGSARLGFSAVSVDGAAVTVGAIVW